MNNIETLINELRIDILQVSELKGDKTFFHYFEGEYPNYLYRKRITKKTASTFNPMIYCSWVDDDYLDTIISGPDGWQVLLIMTIPPTKTLLNYVGANNYEYLLRRLEDRYPQEQLRILGHIQKITDDMWGMTPPDNV